jgi:hypothetical protein
MRVYTKPRRYLPADRYLHWVILCLNEQSSLSEGPDDFSPSIEPFHALSVYIRQLRLLGTVHQAYIELVSGISVQRPIIVENANELHIMALADFVIIGIMSWRDLHCTRSEILVDHVIRHDRQPPIDKRVLCKFPAKVLHAIKPNGCD